MYLYLVIAICLILAVFTVWKEYQRGGTRLGWRIAASLIAVASLACIALPLSYQGERSLPENQAVLLTDGFIGDSISSFKGDSLLTFDAAIKRSYKNVKLVTPDQLTAIKPAVTRLHIFGYGLNLDELGQLDSLAVVFRAAQLPSGISSINWTDRLKQGQELKVQGTYTNTSAKLVRLLLKGLNTTVDSAVIAPQSTVKFSFTDIPKSIGQSVYQLVTTSGKDTTSGESLPVVVEPVKPLKILMLANSPGFDNKFLKNWLADNGFSVAMRSAISKDKFSSAYVNIDQAPLDHLSAELLDKFDVVISDLSAVHTLNSAEAAVLKQQVTQKGLGLIVRADTTFTAPIWVQTGFTVKKPFTKDVKQGTLLIDGKKANNGAGDSGALYIDAGDGTQTLITDAQGHVFAGLNIAGSGKIIFATLNDTYSWALNGDKKDYAAFWSKMISKVARTGLQSQLWETNENVPTVNEPLQLSLKTSAQAGAIKIDDLLLPPQQNELMPYEWQASWWPNKPGWFNPQIDNSTAGEVYVYRSDSWKTIRAARKLSLTKKYAESLGLPDNVTKQIHQKISIPVPKGYFYVLLLIACVWLWIEGKLGQKVI